MGEKVQGYGKCQSIVRTGGETYAFESRTVRVASTKGMSTAESNNFLIRETHTVKDIADMSGSFGSVGKTAIGGTCGNIFVGTAWSPGDDGPAHFLQGADPGKSPEIGIGDPGELFLDAFEMVASELETSIGSMVSFRGKSLQRQGQVSDETAMEG